MVFERHDVCREASITCSRREPDSGIDQGLRYEVASKSIRLGEGNQTQTQRTSEPGDCLIGLASL